MRARCLLFLAPLLWARPAGAWLIFEHDRIGGAAFQTLDLADRETLQAAWQAAVASRGRGAARYCAGIDRMVSAESVVDEHRWCVGFATLAALAGDHGCLPEEVSGAVENGGWMGPLLVEARDRGRATLPLAVDDVARRTREWREHNLALQAIDPGLIPRAQNNRSHFLPPLDVGKGDAVAANLPDYLARALGPGARVSIVPMYIHYHLLALYEAAGKRTPERLWRALLAEAFAIHFLEDAFSAGHVVGTWGDLGQRLGSHDYYSTRGLDVRTWSGGLYNAHGDGFMAAEDERVAAAAVATSLAQLAAALRGGELVEEGAPVGAYSACDGTLAPPEGLAEAARQPIVAEVFRQLPIPPSRHFGMPRFRSEVGAFLGIMLEGNGFAVIGATDQLPSSDTRLRIGLGAGFALEGAFTRFMDGRFLVDTMMVVSMHEYEVGRRAVGFGVRLRMPFVVLPGDMLYLVAPAALIRGDWGYALARTAASGGLGGLERQLILAENLSFQFMLGREVTAVWFPHVGWQLDIPAVELRGERLFTGAFATESVMQIGATLSFDGDERAVGLFVSYAERIRRYMPQSCDDGCD